MSIAGESNRPRGRPRHTGPSVLSPGEFKVMELLWRSSAPLAAAEICTEMRSTRGLAYTTVMTFLEKLHRKGCVRTEAGGRSSLYRPAVSREEALQRCLDAFLLHYFDGSLPSFRTFIDRADRSAVPIYRHRTSIPKNREKPGSTESPSTSPHPENLDVELL